MLKLLLPVQCALIFAQVMALSICFILSREMEKSLFSGGYSAYITFPIGMTVYDSCGANNQMLVIDY